MNEFRFQFRHYVPRQVSALFVKVLSSRASVCAHLFLACAVCLKKCERSQKWITGEMLTTSKHIFVSGQISDLPFPGSAHSLSGGPYSIFAGQECARVLAKMKVCNTTVMCNKREKYQEGK